MSELLVINDLKSKDGKIKEELKYHLKVLKEYYLNNGPIPSNSMSILKFLLRVLEYEGTNTFYFASPVAKAIALAYAMILVSHAADYPQVTGLVINDPHSIKVMGGYEELIDFIIDVLKSM